MPVTGSTVSDADAIYLQRIAEDCAEMLGPEVDLDGLDLDSDTDFVLDRVRLATSALYRARR